MTAEHAKTDKRSIFLICILIFAVAFGIRLPGIGWGLKNDLHNQSYHPDEPLIFDFVHRSHVFRGPLERQYYNYGTLYYAVLRTSEAIGTMVGGIHAPASLALSDIKSPQDWDALNAYVSEFDYWGRLASAFFGALTAVVIFLIMRRWVSVIGAIAGAALIVFAPAHVEHSRFQTVDVISLFFVSLAMLAAIRLLRQEIRDNKQWWVEIAVAAALTGCAASTRYSDGLTAVAVMAAIIIRRPRMWLYMVAAVPLISIVAFCITTPGVITESSYFIQNFTFQAQHANTGHGLVFVGRPSGFIFHLYLFAIGIGLFGAVLGLCGLIYAAFKRHEWAWVILAYFIPYYLSIGTLQVMFLRYGFPLYVGIACGFAYAISAIQLKSNRSWLAAAIAFLSLLGLENPQSGIRGTALFTKWMTEEDPRDAAARYMINIARTNPNMQVGIVGDSPWFWSPAIVKDADFLEFQPKDIRVQYLSHTNSPRVVPFTWRPDPLPEYATVSSYQNEDGQRLRGRTDLDPDTVTSINQNTAMMDELNRLYQPVATFGEGGPTIHDLEYIQPTVWVLKRRDLP